MFEKSFIIETFGGTSLRLILILGTCLHSKDFNQFLILISYKMVYNDCTYLFIVSTEQLVHIQFSVFTMYLFIYISDTADSQQNLVRVQLSSDTLQQEPAMSVWS